MCAAASVLGIRAFIPGPGMPSGSLSPAPGCRAIRRQPAGARALQGTLNAVRDVMYEAGSRMVAVSARLETRGVCRAWPRPPFLPLESPAIEAMRQTLVHLKVPGASPTDHSRPAVAIDSGTTNSRVHLLRDEAVFGAASGQVGVLDTTKTGSHRARRRGCGTTSTRRSCTAASLWTRFRTRWASARSHPSWGRPDPAPGGPGRARSACGRDAAGRGSRRLSAGGAVGSPGRSSCPGACSSSYGRAGRSGSGSSDRSSPPTTCGACATSGPRDFRRRRRCSWSAPRPAAPSIAI